MNNEYAESCRVISEYWALKAEGKLVEKLEGRSYNNLCWVSINMDHVPDPNAHQYRWKLETVKHPGGEYPKPCQSIEEVRNAPDPHYAAVGIKGAAAWAMKSYSDEFVGQVVELGAAHSTKEAALQHARVMLGLGGSDNE